jgi:hypothetical protein
MPTEPDKPFNWTDKFVSTDATDLGFGGKDEPTDRRENPAVRAEFDRLMMAIGQEDRWPTDDEAERLAQLASRLRDFDELPPDEVD